MGTSLLPPSPPPTMPRNFPFYPYPIFSLLLFHLLFLSLPNPTTPAPISQDNYLSYYSAHCHAVVPESPETGLLPDFLSGAGGEDRILSFSISWLTGGAKLISPHTSGESEWGPSERQFSFRPKRGTFSLAGRDGNVVSFQAKARLFLGAGGFKSGPKGGSFRDVRFRPPRIPVRKKLVEFELYGFWSRSDGNVCMVGSDGSSRYNVALKLSFPVKFSDYRSLISGKLESLDDPVGGSAFFEPVLILGLPSSGEYKFSLAAGEGNTSACLGGFVVKEENLHLGSWGHGECLAKLGRAAKSFELEYGRECSGAGASASDNKCNPLGVVSGGLPKYMMIKVLSCENKRAIRVLAALVRSPSVSFGLLERAFNPNIMLIGEAAWDEEKDILCAVLCRLLNFTNSLANPSVGDCSTQLSLRFLRTYSLRNRAFLEGLISSNKSVDDSSYVHEIRFHSFQRNRMAEPGLRYNYTVLDRVSRSCPRQKAGKRRLYPDSHSRDMQFDVTLINRRGELAYMGSASPLFVDDHIYDRDQTKVVHWQHGLVNISYAIGLAPSATIRFHEPDMSSDWDEISAEGTYDDKTGALCMIGCRHLKSYALRSKTNDTMDCEVLISLLFSPLNGNGRIQGTIKSLRVKSDPLYFEQFKMSSSLIYASQAAKSVWRMDMEITMLLISNTLACIFVGLQLYHVKKHPDVLPSMCLVMLIVLTLGYMIPLLLNFEALFVKSPNRQNLLLGTAGWLEINEVAVRAVTMVAFLLQFRLLQLAWSTRQSDGSHQKLWLAERRVLYLSIPMYISGALISYYMHKWSSSYASASPYLKKHFFRHQQTQPWGSLKSYAGLVLDGFLLPQIMFNLVSNTMENTLAPVYYVGSTLVRVLPHAYDLYRTHSSAWSRDWSFIYANHRQDFFSTAWDIVIPIVGLIFVALLYSQQRFGGRCFLPKRFRGMCEYEKVPVVSSDEQQREVAIS